MKKTIIVGLILVASSMLLSTSCSNSTEDDQQKDGAEEIHTIEYQCPMKCEGDKTYKEPGSCPKCGMDLVEKK